MEGVDPRRGLFTIRAGRASYDQLKTAFVLVGDVATPGVIAFQQYLGAPLSETSFQSLSYSQRTGNWEMQGVKGELNQIDVK